MDGVGVDERDLQAEEPKARAVVDQLGPFRGELVEDGADVVDLVGDVMHPGAALGEEAADRRFLAGRRQQLDAAANEWSPAGRLPVG